LAHGCGQLAKLGFAQLDAGGVKVIDELEQLPLPADELGAGLSATAIVVRHVLQCLDLLGQGRDVPRATLSAVGKDGAFMKLAAVAVAGRLAALSPQRVERARQERLATEGGLEQARQELLELEDLCAEGAEALVHEMDSVVGGRLSVCHI
jgi:hypothetical protein